MIIMQMVPMMSPYPIYQEWHWQYGICTHKYTLMSRAHLTYIRQKTAPAGVRGQLTLFSVECTTIWRETTITRIQ